MLAFKEYVKNNWLVVVTNTQLVERWVKDSNECTYSGKDDNFASMIAVCCSSSVFEYKDDAKVEAYQRDLRGNQFFLSGTNGTRIDRRTGGIETTKQKVQDVRGSHY